MCLDLSQHLQVHSKTQTNCECQGAPRRTNAATLRQKRLSALKLSHIKRERRTGDERVPCVSFGRATSLAFVIFLLSNVLMDVTVLCIVLGSAVSTVSLAREIRRKTLKQRQLNEKLYESSLQLRLVTRELQMAEAEWSRAMPLSAFRLEEDMIPSDDAAC